MKLTKTLVAVCALSAATAFAVDPQRSETTCDQLADKYEATAEAKARFADLAGTCEGVYEINGALYVRSEAVIRSKHGGKVRLYMPATDHTFEVTPDQSGRVWVGSRKMRVRDLDRGDTIGIYLSVDKFATERIDEVAFAVPDESSVEILPLPTEEVEALPTTASQLPLLALLSALMLAAGLFMRSLRSKA